MFAAPPEWIIHTDLQLLQLFFTFSLQLQESGLMLCEETETKTIQTQHFNT